MKKELLREHSMVNLRQIIAEGKETSSTWTAPIWKLDKLNLNGRVYSTKLAQRIVAENKVTGCCDGHDPSYTQDYKNYMAVAKNPRIEGEELWVDIKIIDESYQALLSALIAEGVPIGVSSVGYGECDKDGVVDPNTYELVRYLDFVSCPAGEVFATPKKESTDNEPIETDSMESAERASLDALMAKVERYTKVESYREKELKR